MNFQELNQKIGPLIEADWHQHSNGNGWVHKNAKVSDETYVGGVPLSGVAQSIVA